MERKQMDPDEFLSRALIRPQPRPGLIRSYIAASLGVLMLFGMVGAFLVVTP